MNSPFKYCHYVTGKDFVGRHNDVKAFSNLLRHHENIVMYEPVKSGKESLIKQSFIDLKSTNPQFITAEIDLLRIRSMRDFLCTFGDAVIKAFCLTPDDYSRTALSYLIGTSFKFDQNLFTETGKVLTVDSDIKENDINAIFRLPYLLSLNNDCSLYVVINEFQNLSLFPEEKTILSSLEHLMHQKACELTRPNCSFILLGSRLNAMKVIFEEQKLFNGLVEYFPLSQIPEKALIEHITKGLLSGGKVIDGTLIEGICRLFRCNVWYVQHFISICDSLSKGYIMEPILLEGLEILLSIHEPRFLNTINDLTSYQLSFLEAIINQEFRFTSSEVMDKYGFNSSANVKRIKEALMKKEVITFDEKDNPVIIDPLFEYWLKKRFFCTEQKF